MPDKNSQSNDAAQPLLLRPEQVAFALNVSRATTYRLMSAGVIPSVRVGGSRRTTRSQLEQYLATLEAQ